MLRNTDNAFGSVSQFLHWMMALAIFSLFGLGLWMTSLTYYDPWYTRGPFIHEGIGVIVSTLLIFRLYWRLTNIRPDDSDLRPFERGGALFAHWSMYGLISAIVVSGYLISTGDGRSLDVFGLFAVPSVVQGEKLADSAGAVHYYAAFTLIGVSVIHTLAALKHHFIDKNFTLRRMLPGHSSKTET